MPEPFDDQFEKDGLVRRDPFSNDPQAEPNAPETPTDDSSLNSEPAPLSKPRHMLPHRGAMILALGLTGVIFAFTAGGLVFCCPPFAVIGLGLTLPAWTLGRADLKLIDQGGMDATGRGLTMAGMILGIIGTVLCGLFALLMVGFVAMTTML